MTASLAPAREPAHRRFRLAVVVASVVAAVVGSVLLATRDPGERATTRGITATLRVPGHPGSVAAGADVLWVALNGDPRGPVADRPLLRLDLATGTVVQAVHVGGEVAYLARDRERLIASVKPVGDGGFGRRRLVALDWRSGAVLPLGESHLSDTDARKIDGPVDHIVRAAGSLWALEVRPGKLLQLDPSTLAVLRSHAAFERPDAGLAAGDGYLWVTAPDAGEVLRIDPLTRAMKRVHVGGFPIGIVFARRQVWLADRAGGTVIRLDGRRLRAIGDPIHVGAKPSWLTVAGGSLYVSDQDAGTIARVDLRSGEKVGQLLRIAPTAKGTVAPVLTSSRADVWVSDFVSNTVTRIASPASSATPSREVTVRGTGNGPVNPGPNGMGVTNGGVAGTGRFTIRGAINDHGTYVSYRSVRGEIAKVRTVAVGQNGTITFVTTIHLWTESPAPWKITSSTKSYAGLHGNGTVTVDNYESDPYTFVMKGTVSS